MQLMSLSCNLREVKTARWLFYVRQHNEKEITVVASGPNDRGRLVGAVPGTGGEESGIHAILPGDTGQTFP